MKDLYDNGSTYPNCSLIKKYDFNPGKNKTKYIYIQGVFSK